MVPAYNEQESISALFREVADTMDAAGCVFEVTFVDDGSSDRTADAIKSLAQVGPESVASTLRITATEVPIRILTVTRASLRLRA